ncbi:type VI secretion system baseplate subunit TssE [Swingsia samuiensis]|uniref:Type VI secretion system baseplate subunit TssE n=1 Tax=Swingsia samuiensis TaxID=1293412 RepID=A0A4Y6UHP0_9PROT|nr:type VI secretion system baseplate subunit TssE [Swingsia samuiensis]QDH16330.1 type VI secretion system baseplate subunit TssE [Swingsia samuiensis]
MKDYATPTLSVLDRLLDAHPERADPPPSNVRTLAQIHAALRRDLEALLNSDRPWVVLKPHQATLQSSPLGYGLSDVTARALSDDDERERIRTEVENTLRRFDSRLTNIRVSLLPDNAPMSTVIRLQIEGVLLLDPQPELVRYSTAILPPGQPISIQAVRET